MTMQHLNNSSESNNFSLSKNFTFPPPSGPSALEWNIRVSIDALISVTSFIGNFLVLIVIYNWKKTHRTPFQILVANLSISDLAQICVYLLFSYLVKTNSDFSCKFGTAFYTSLVMFSMYLMTTIAVFRCRSILHPFKRRPSIKFTYYTTAGLWILSNAFVSPVYVVTIWDEDNGYCNELWPAQIYNKVYTIALFVVQYVIPFSIMAVSYIKIIFNLKQHKAPPTDYNKKHYLMMKRKRDVEVIKISAAIVTLYTILTLPNQIAWISLVVFQNFDLFMTILKFSTHLQLLHNCCNPFVYGTISRQFRSQFAKAVCKCMTCTFKRNSARTVRMYSSEQGRSNLSFEELGNGSVVLMHVMKN